MRLDQALRRALEKFYPSLGDVYLVDYKVRVISGALSGTASLVRVLITSTDGKTQWGTVGVSANIVEASWRALVDAVEYKLMKDGTKPKIEVASQPAGVRERNGAMCL
jgi:2-isopropylmalate synthase